MNKPKKPNIPIFKPESNSSIELDLIDFCNRHSGLSISELIKVLQEDCKELSDDFLENGKLEYTAIEYDCPNISLKQETRIIDPIELEENKKYNVEIRQEYYKMTVKYYKDMEKYKKWKKNK
jgi:predicted transcriptional regulator